MAFPILVDSAFFISSENRGYMEQIREILWSDFGGNIGRFAC